MAKPNRRRPDKPQKPSQAVSKSSASDDDGEVAEEAGSILSRFGPRFFRIIGTMLLLRGLYAYKYGGAL